MSVRDASIPYVRSVCLCALLPLVFCTGAYAGAPGALPPGSPDPFNAGSFNLLAAHTLALGLAFGALLAAAAYGLLRFLAQRQQQQCLFLIFMTALLACHLANSGMLRLLSPAAGAVFTPQAPLFGYILLVCSAPFSRSFLESKRYAPRTDLLIRLCPFVLLAGLVLFLRGATAAATYVGHGTALLLLALYAVAALAALRNGVQTAGPYLAAWAFFLAGVLLALGNSLFAFSHGFAFSHARLFAAALASVPLSFALAERSTALQQEQHRLAKESGRQAVNIMDELTGLYNKRFFDSSLENAIENSRLTGSPLSLLMLNVDNFRRFSETYGQPQGNKILTVLGELIRKGVRSQDVPCRFDNEEFAIILPGATENDAMHAAERFRKSFANLFFQPNPGMRLNSALSIGVATYGTDDTASSVFQRAGQALYKAKSSRGKIESAGKN